MRAIKKGATDQSTVIRILDSTTFLPETGVVAATAGLALSYRREGGAVVALTESDLAAVDSAHSDGGIKHVGSGYYRVDLPDLAVATGANGVAVFGDVTGMVIVGSYHHLVDYDPQSAANLGIAALTGHTPQTGDSFARIGATGSGLTSLASQVSVNALPTAAGNADAVWDELRAGHAVAGSFGVLFDAAISSRSSHAAADVWTSAARTLTAATNITSTGGTTVPQTGDSFGRLGAPAGASVSADVAAVLAKWTTAMAEAYAADGVAPTPEQAMFMMLQNSMEFSISGTTLTVKKLDGTTTAMTVTLDSATAPTSRTRAT